MLENVLTPQCDKIFGNDFQLGNWRVFFMKCEKLILSWERVLFWHIFGLKNVKNTQKIDNFAKKFFVFTTYFPKMRDPDVYFQRA